MLNKEEVNGANEISKVITLNLNYNNEEYILIISVKENQSIFNLHSQLHPDLKFQNIFKYEKMKNESLFKISDNLNDIINLISECIKSKYYSLNEKNDGMLLTILSMVPGIKDVDFLLKNNFSDEEEIEVNQYKRKEMIINNLKKEIIQLKDSNEKKEKEIIFLRNLIINNRKKQKIIHEKIIKKIEENNIKVQNSFKGILNINNNEMNNNKESYSIKGYLSNLLSMIKGFASHSNFLYYENKENFLNLYKGITLALFPNNNIITSFNNNFQIIDLQNNKVIFNYEKAHENVIACFCIIDNNNFLTGSDKTIKKWKIENEKIILIDTLYGHNRTVNKIIFLENQKIISCSNDHTVKIWEKFKEYQCIKTFEHKDTVRAIILFDSNTLISGDYNGQLKVWDLNSLDLKFTLEKCEVVWYESLKKIDNDRIIVGGKFEKIMKVISINQKKIILEIPSNFVVYCITVLKNGYIAFAGGAPFNIDIRNNQNFNLIQNIITHYTLCINIIIELNNGDLLVTNDENKIKVFKCNL